MASDLGACWDSLRCFITIADLSGIFAILRTNAGAAYTIEKPLETAQRHRARSSPTSLRQRMINHRMPLGSGTDRPMSHPFGTAPASHQGEAKSSQAPPRPQGTHCRDYVFKAFPKGIGAMVPPALSIVLASPIPFSVTFAPAGNAGESNLRAIQGADAGR